MTKNSVSTGKPAKTKNSSLLKNSSPDKGIKRSAGTHDEAIFSDKQRREIRELFESVYVEKRGKANLTNFQRGIFFGLGTFLGGTIVVAVVVWILTQTIDIFPWASDFTRQLIDSLQP